MTRIVINAVIAKQIGGGGFQIASNFIRTANQNHDVEWIYFVSADLDKAIGKEFSEKLNISYFVFPTQPDFKTHRKVQKKMNSLIEQKKPDVVYSILAPSYSDFACKEVMRCSNAWNYVNSVNKWAWGTLSFKSKLLFRLKGAYVCRLMRKTKYFVTQTETAKRSIISVTNTDENNVRVIPNVLPAVYLHSPVKKSLHGDCINIVYVSATQPHKNLELIPEVASVLKNKYGLMNFEFILTIPYNDEKYINDFNAIVNHYDVDNQINNVGYQSQQQLIELYSKCDIYFFPSLLETFSATLLEAMYFQMPIVATDFDFNREVADGAALYFQPKNAEEAAEQIACLIKDQYLYGEMIAKAKKRIMRYDDYSKNFSDIVNFLIEVANK